MVPPRRARPARSTFQTLGQRLLNVAQTRILRESLGDVVHEPSETTLRAHLRKGGPLTQADSFEILVKVVTGDAPPFESEAAECL